MADPFELEVTYTGYNRVRNQLRAAASFYAKETNEIIEKHVESEADRLRNRRYPSQLPGQKYKRTYQFKKAFRAEKRAAAKWAITNRVKDKRGRAYAVWVAKRGMQAKIHQGRWWTVEGEVEKNMKSLRKNLTVHLEQLLNSQRD